MRIDLSGVDAVSLATMAAAVAALASTVAAFLSVMVGRRNADATDRSAAATETAANAQLRAAEATDALRRLEIERGHEDLAPRLEIEYGRTGPDDVLGLKLTNPDWRGYRLNATVLRNSGGSTSRQPVSAMVELLPRGAAFIFPVQPGARSEEEVLKAYDELYQLATLELDCRTDDLWRCPCDRPDEYGHWRERRQIPPPPHPTQLRSF